MTRGQGSRGSSSDDSAPVHGPRDVKKRNGRFAAFEPTKIRAAVWRAMQAVGDADEAFADDVAAVVALALRREASLSSEVHWTPDIETIQDRVERALIEMGRAAVAKAYILYRDKRSRARDAAVRADAVRAEDGGTRAPVESENVRVRQADRYSPWSRGRIAAALVGEADLPRDLAERVASSVEERVLASGLSEVSTALVRALVDHELVALGRVDALRHTEPVALPRHDLRRLSTGAGAEIWEPWRRTDIVVGGPPPFDGLARLGDLGAAAGGEVLRRFASTEVLDRRSSELHAAGELHVEDLRSPQRFLHVSVPPELVGGERRGAGEVDGVESAYAALATVAELLQSTSRGLTIDDAGPLVRGLLEAGEALGPWLAALGAVGWAAGQRIVLRADGPHQEPERAALVLALSAVAHGTQTPLVLMDVDGLAACLDEGPAVRTATLEAIAAERLIASWHRGNGRAAGPGATRQRNERGLIATAGAVAINLPRLARRVGAWQEERLLEELFGLLSCALEAARSLAVFQERCGPLSHTSGSGLGSRDGRRLFARTSYALVPIGLPEALRILGDGQTDPVQGARILGLMVEAAARFPEPGAPRVELCSFFGAEAARRLAFTDRVAQDAPRSQQAWLFAEMSGQEALVRAYTPGFAAGPSAAWRSGESEAELVRTVPSGLLHPRPSSAAGPAPAVVVERFVSLRRASLAQDLGPRGRGSVFEVKTSGAELVDENDSKDVSNQGVLQPRARQSDEASRGARGLRLLTDEAQIAATVAARDEQARSPEQHEP